MKLRVIILSELIQEIVFFLTGNSTEMVPIMNKLDEMPGPEFKGIRMFN